MEAVVVRDDKLRDLEVLTIGSDPIDKTSEAANKEKAADAAAELAVCPLVAAMLAVETTTAAELEATEAEKEKATAIAAEEATAAATAKDQRWQKGQRVKKVKEEEEEQQSSNSEEATAGSL